MKYKIKDGKRKEFISRLLEEQIVERSRQEPGNIKYEIGVPVDSSNEVCITELWVNKAEQKRHGQTKQYAIQTQNYFVSVWHYFVKVYFSCKSFLTVSVLQFLLYTEQFFCPDHLLTEYKESPRF